MHFDKVATISLGGRTTKTGNVKHIQRKVTLRLGFYH